MSNNNILKIKPVPGFSNYTINNSGAVLNVKSGKYLKPIVKTRGYRAYALYKDNKRYEIPRHRLVCSVFNPKPNMKYLTVDHLNGVAGDDRSCNLEFVTITENIRRYYHNGGRRTRITEKVVVFYPLTNKTVICKNYVETAELLGLHKDTVLARLHTVFGRIFPDMTMIKYASCNTEFPVYPDVLLERAKHARKQPLLVRNMLTCEILEFDTMTKASVYLGISLAMMSTRLANDTDPVFPGLFCVRRMYDTRPWMKLDWVSLLKQASGFSKSTRYCVIIIYGVTHLFTTNAAAARYLGILTTTLCYRLSNNVETKNIKYYYLDDLLSRKSLPFNPDDVTIHP